MNKFVRVQAAVSLALVLAGCAQPTVAVAASGAPHGGQCFALPQGAPAHRPIVEVQGRSERSPLVGQQVTLRGVVTADFQPTLRGFFLQSRVPQGGRGASDGIFVYTHRTPRNVAVGDLVQVSGSVGEYHGMTQLEQVSRFEVCSAGHAVEPTRVSLPNDDWERFEGMLLSVDGVVAENYLLGRGGSVTIADERPVQFTQLHRPDAAGFAAHQADVRRRTLKVDDGSLVQNPHPLRFARGGQPLGADNTLRGGDSARVTGVLSFGWDGWSGSRDAYRLHATRADFSGPARPAAPGNAQLNEPQLRVAAMNVLNYFNGDGQGGAFPTPRGADDANELARQQAKLVSALLGLDADVVGLVELENDYDQPVPAVKSLVDALNAVAGEGTYAFVNPGGRVGTDRIAVGFIYRPRAVTPLAGPAQLTSGFDAAYDDSRNRVTLAQSFRAARSGGVFTAAVAHLKSKGSACGEGDDDPLGGQGNCARTRTNAARVLGQWLAQHPTGVQDADYVLLGDLNSYAMEDPIRVLEAGVDGAAGTADDLVNLFGRSSYGYVFDGQTGSLDHALASPSLGAQVTGAAVWHVNADEPAVLDYDTRFKHPEQLSFLYAPHAYRSSDHDPLVIGLKLSADR